MPVKPIFNPDHFYFVTSSAVGHTHLFHNDVIKRIIADSLHHMQITRQMRLFVFVIMPNHVHFIAQFNDINTLSSVMRDFKKFTARQIYRQFSVEKNQKGLGILKTEGQRVKQEYKVWADDYDARDVFSVTFLQQKMDYIHNHPCQQQWKLVEAPEEYLWSTARFYVAGIPCVIPIDDVREFLL